MIRGPHHQFLEPQKTHNHASPSRVCFACDSPCKQSQLPLEFVKLETHLAPNSVSKPEISPPSSTYRNPPKLGRVVGSESV